MIKTCDTIKTMLQINRIIRILVHPFLLLDALSIELLD